jgi:hypothetical protein
MKTKTNRIDCEKFEYGHCTNGVKCSLDCSLFKSKYIALEIQCDGDRSVGLWGDRTSVLIERRFIESDDYGTPDETRAWFKKQMTTIFTELFDDNNIHAMFEDECYGCGKPKSECHCPKDI